MKTADNPDVTKLPATPAALAPVSGSVTAIPIPIHPDDIDLPISVINLRLPSGKVGTIVLPIQGEKTLDNALATLAIWKPTIVAKPEPAYEI